MVNLEYNHESNIFTVKSLFDSNVHLDCIAVDLNTNLPFVAWWTKLSTNQFSDFSIADHHHFLLNIPGVEINIYLDKDLIFSKKFQWGKLDSRYNFVCPKSELAYASWPSLRSSIVTA